MVTVFLGFFSGILGGLSTFYAPPLMAYLVSANLEKEFFIRTVASMYFVGSIPLYSSLIYHGLGTTSDLLMSSYLVIPAIIGQFFGTKISPSELFKLFFAQFCGKPVEELCL